MADFDWTKHMHDRLGDMLIRLVSLKGGKTLEEYGLIGEPGEAKAKRVDIRITVNGHEIPYDAFVEQCYAVDNEQLQAAARDVIEQRFGTQLDQLESLLGSIRAGLESEVIDQLRPEWERVVKEGPSRK